MVVCILYTGPLNYAQPAWYLQMYELYTINTFNFPHVEKARHKISDNAKHRNPGLLI